MLVPGVLSGSKGPLLYPAEEVRKSPDDWNHIPIVVYHPMKDGKPVSARSPSILSKYGVGFVFHSRTDSKGVLKGEGWLDVEATRRVDKSVLDSVQLGKPIELSTGLFVDDEPAPEGAIFNDHRGSRKYVGIARNYKPDHLAILPSGKGACSLADGCGVLINHLRDLPGSRSAPLTKSDVWNKIGEALGLLDCRSQRGRTRLSNARKGQALTGGRWITVEGRHLYIRDGKVVSGPSHLKGMDVGDKTGTGERNLHDVQAEISAIVRTPNWLDKPDLVAKRKALFAEKSALESKGSQASGSAAAPFGGAGASKPSSKDIEALASAIGGKGGKAKFSGGQVRYDPAARMIAEKGKHQSVKGKINLSMEDGRCHWNVAKALEDSKIDSVVIGYAKHPDNGGAWHQHTWGLKGGRVVETTPSNLASTDYFGVTLSADEAKAFVAHSKVAQPGAGKMRHSTAEPTSNQVGNEGVSWVTEEDRKTQPWLSVNHRLSRALSPPPLSGLVAGGITSAEVRIAVGVLGTFDEGQLWQTK